MTQLTIKLDPKVLKSTNKKVRSAARSAARDTINKSMTLAIRETVKSVSSSARIPEKIIRNRLDEHGQIKGKRVTRKQATVKNLTGSINVYLRGIPLFQLVTKANRVKGRVKARGKVYKRAFWQKNRVFYANKQRKLWLPKFGVRKRFIREYEQRLFSQKAISDFKRDWNKRLQKKFIRISNAR